MDDGIFFQVVRARLYAGGMNQAQVDGHNSILAEWRLEFLSTTSIPQLAYCLATAFHETGGKMQPVMENLNYTSAEGIRKTWPSRFASAAAALPFVRNPRALANKVYNGRMGNRVGSDDGWLRRGRGLVQLTGMDNDVRATKELRKLGILKGTESLVDDPLLALRPDVAVALLFVGMEQGWFTGVTLDKTIDDRIDGDEERDFIDGRRIINGTDKAAKIARDAMAYLEALVKAGAEKSPLAGGIAPAATKSPAKTPTPPAANVGKSGAIPVIEAHPAKTPTKAPTLTFWQRVHRAMSRA